MQAAYEKQIMSLTM